MSRDYFTTLNTGIFTETQENVTFYSKWNILFDNIWVFSGTRNPPAHRTNDTEVKTLTVKNNGKDASFIEQFITWN